eukprot:117132-Chlamydomonas_euryale.AAC.10
MATAGRGQGDVGSLRFAPHIRVIPVARPVAPHIRVIPVARPVAPGSVPKVQAHPPTSGPAESRTHGCVEVMDPGVLHLAVHIDQQPPAVLGFRHLHVVLGAGLVKHLDPRRSDLRGRCAAAAAAAAAANAAGNTGRAIVSAADGSGGGGAAAVVSCVVKVVHSDSKWPPCCVDVSCKQPAPAVSLAIIGQVTHIERGAGT